MMRDFQFSRIVVERASYASKPFLRRPKAKTLLEDLKVNDIIVVPALGRIFQSAADALRTIEKLDDLRVGLHILDLGGDIERNGLKELLIVAASAFARSEPNTVAAADLGSVTLRMKRRGPLPFGYRANADGFLEEDHDEQRAIRHMRELRAEGKSYQAIAKEVGEQLALGISHMGVRKILERKVELKPKSKEKVELKPKSKKKKRMRKVELKDSKA